MNSNTQKKYSDDQIQFLQTLVKEQRDLDQQIKVLRKACREREGRKKQLDTTIIKYFKTNDISHINLQSSNCRMECVTTKTRSGLSQKFVTEMLDDLLKDEELARDVLEYLLSGRKITHKHKLKTIENYQQKRKRKAPEPKPEVKYTDDDKNKLVLKLKNRINGDMTKKVDKPEEINLNVQENKINPPELTSNILQQIKENAAKLNKESIQIEPVVKPEVIVKPETKSTYKTNKVKNNKTKPKKHNIVLKKASKQVEKPVIDLNQNIQNILDTSDTNEIIKEIPDNISFDKPKKNTLENQIDSFIKNKMAGLISSPNSVTNLPNLYEDLMKMGNIAVNNINSNGAVNVN